MTFSVSTQKRQRCSKIVGFLTKKNREKVPKFVGKIFFSNMKFPVLKTKGKPWEGLTNGGSPERGWRDRKTLNVMEKSSQRQQLTGEWNPLHCEPFFLACSRKMQVQRNSTATTTSSRHWSRIFSHLVIASCGWPKTLALWLDKICLKQLACHWTWMSAYCFKKGKRQDLFWLDSERNEDETRDCAGEVTWRWERRGC